MVGAGRILTLITTPLLLHRRPRPFIFSLSLLHKPISFPIHKFHSLHTPAATRDESYRPYYESEHQWPEWSTFLSSLSLGGSSTGRMLCADVDDVMVESEGLPEEFVRVCQSALTAAREKPDLLSFLPRRDIQVVVENGTPFLFRSALDTTRRMRTFLGMAAENKALETDIAQTVDLMKYLLSYASNTVVSSDRGGICNGQLLESSVRRLLRLLSCRDEYMIRSMVHNVENSYEQTPRRIGPSIEMKRGDWICSKCNFMNFARNVKCLECEEARPKRLLTGGEWECPQCDFFNYGRNQVCLRCDCKRPSEASFGTNSSSNQVHGDTAYANKPDIESKLAANEEKAQRWFSKISQMENTSDSSSPAADEDFPEIMPLRKGENKFVVSTRKTPLERRLANTQRSSKSSLENNESNSKGISSNYVPFVPFPSDMFAKKPPNAIIKEVENTDSPTKPTEESTYVSGSSRPLHPIESSPSQQDENSDKEKEKDEKPERWFKKMAELQGVEDLSTIPKTEDFPEIMPMRKGENRFVVSKKKDRSLTSPTYKRKMAMEQTSNTNFVPFVPFPPDYFAKKNKDPALEDKTENSSNPVTPNNTQNRSGEIRINPEPKIENQRTGIENLNTGNVNSSSQSSENRQKDVSLNSSSGWKGKSLEGSAVAEEPDPLDMSEEAKAQRWFRRAAQIKDISELSQIPDEDFPSIMPMRKGVNRFVVSKRKTPLERRLTSPQYKRNLPSVHSDTIKKENENS